MSQEKRRKRQKDRSNAARTTASLSPPSVHSSEAVQESPAPAGLWASQRFRIGAVIFLIALAARLVYLWEISKNPAFLEPLVDSQAYDAFARALVEKGEWGVQAFWQPFFYPVFLAAVYFLSGSSVFVATLIQLALGAVCCVLTYALGETVFNRRVGVLAGAIAALYGPMIFFEGKLLATGWAALWSLTLLLMFVKTRARPKAGFCFLLGVAGALSVLTRPTFLPFFVAGGAWLLVVLRKDAADWKTLVRKTVLILAGFVLIVLPVALLTYWKTGRFSFLPESGGINLYIGNNPDSDRTLSIRPGPDWENLVLLPMRQGVHDRRDDPRFFMGLFRDYVAGHPADYALGLARKTFWFANSREMPRNEDPYLARRSSTLMSVLLWKIDGFGFPFGILFPLALLGLVCRGKRVPFAVILFIVLVPLAVVAVFVTARYRTPTIPVFAILAALGIEAFADAVRNRRWKQVALMGLGVGAAGALFSLPRSSPLEEFDYEAEMYCMLGARSLEQGRPREAVERLRKALELKPDYKGARTTLAEALVRLGESEEAIEQLRKDLEAAPDLPQAHNALGLALFREGKYEEAIAHFEKAIEGQAELVPARENLAKALLAAGKAEQSLPHFRKAIEQNPRSVELREGMGNAFFALGRFQEAATCYRHALRIEPADGLIHDNLGNALFQLGQIEGAAEEYRRALQIDPRSASAHHHLGVALDKLGQTRDALPHFAQSLDIAPDNSETHFDFGNALLRAGNSEGAIRSFEKAAELDPNHYWARYNCGVVLMRAGRAREGIAYFRSALRIEARPELLDSLAWILATHRDSDVRDGAEAVRLAERACQETVFARPAFLDTLAAAYAEAGRFDDATRTAEKALALPQTQKDGQLAAGLRSRLALFRQRKPYRE